MDIFSKLLIQRNFRIVAFWHIGLDWAIILHISQTFYFETILAEVFILCSFLRLSYEATYREVFCLQTTRGEKRERLMLYLNVYGAVQGLYEETQIVIKTVKC